LQCLLISFRRKSQISSLESTLAKKLLNEYDFLTLTPLADR